MSKFDEWLGLTTESGREVLKSWKLSDRFVTSIHYLRYYFIMSSTMTLYMSYLQEPQNTLFISAMMFLAFILVVVVPHIVLKNNRIFVRECELTGKMEGRMQWTLFSRWLDCFPLNISPLMCIMSFGKFCALALALGLAFRGLSGIIHAVQNNPFKHQKIK